VTKKDELVPSYSEEIFGWPELFMEAPGNDDCPDWDVCSSNGGGGSACGGGCHPPPG
jgi:hypothetical protein